MAFGKTAVLAILSASSYGIDYPTPTGTPDTYFILLPDVRINYQIGTLYIVLSFPAGTGSRSTVVVGNGLAHLLM